MSMFRKNYARKYAKAEARVADLAQQSAQLQVQRSEADAAAAQYEAQRLRAELDALNARYVTLERKLGSDRIAG